MRERLKERFEKKQEKEKRFPEFSEQFKKFSEELKQERIIQEEEYKKQRPFIDLMDNLINITKQNNFKFNPQEGLINVKKKNRQQQLDLSFKIINELKSSYFYKNAKDFKRDIDNFENTLKINPTQKTINEILKTFPKELAKEIKKQKIKGEFEFKPPEIEELYERTKKEREPTGIEEKELTGIEEPTGIEGEYKEESEFKEEEPTLVEKPKQMPLFLKSTDMGFLVVPEFVQNDKNFKKLDEYDLLKKGKNKEGYVLTGDKNKIQQVWKKLQLGNKNDIVQLQAEQELTDYELSEYLLHQILARLDIDLVEKKGSGVRKKKIKGGFIPQLLASVLIPTLLSGNGKKSSKKSSKKIKIISV
jgi:hypothetical protein